MNRRNFLKSSGMLLAPLSGESMELLQGGRCINSLGNIFTGPDAPQKCVDNLMGEANGCGAVWLGNSVTGISGNYSPLRIESNLGLRMTVQGLGAATVLDGADVDHALALVDPTNGQSGLARLRINDVRCETDKGSNFDGVHAVGVSETWLHRVETQGVGRDGMYLAPRNGIYLDECFTEGSRRHSVAFRDTDDYSGHIFRIRGGSFRAPKSNTNFHFSTPHGNGINRVLISDCHVVSGSADHWLYDATGGNIYRSLVSGIVGTSGGYSIAEGSDIKVGIET